MNDKVSHYDNYFRQVNQGRENRFYLMLFIVVMLGGAVRKWVTTSELAGNLVLLLQMILPYAVFVFRSSAAVNPFNKFRILIIYFGYLAFHIIYPLQLTMYHGMLGMMIHGLFWIGFFFYLCNRRLFNPSYYLPFMFVMVGVEIVLAFIQFGLPASNILNKYATDQVKNIATVGDKVRVSGTFSYLSGYTAFLLFLPFFIWALIRKNYSTWIVVAVTIAGLIAAFMTGSRSGTLLFLAFSVILFLQSYKLADIGRVLARLLIPGTIALMVILVYNKISVFDRIETAYDGFSKRVSDNRKSGEEQRRIVGDFANFDFNRYKYPILGIGVGATYQGATALFGTSEYKKEFGYIESEFMQVLLEGGIILLLFKISLVTLIIMRARLPSKLLKVFTWVTMVYAAPIVYNVHNACFLLLGIMLVDNIVWRQEIEAQWKAEQKTFTEETEEDVRQIL